MNTYVQDTIVPIYIFLQYGHYMLKFPVNPESLRIDRSSGSITSDIEGIGEVSTQTTPKLAKININSFFWQGNNYLPSFLYVDWLKNWQESKKPAHLLVTRLNFSMQVTCENFSYWINAGEEEDVYFNLDLLEYKVHGAKKLNFNVPPKSKYFGFDEIYSEVASTKKRLDVALAHVLVDIPRITRQSISDKPYTNPYTVQGNDTILTITKKITGNSEDWENLYQKNKDVLTSSDNLDLELEEGMKLNLPDEWIQDNNSQNLEVSQ